MSKIRAWFIIITLFLTNLFCLFEWAMTSTMLRSWQQFAIAQDTVIIQMDEALKLYLATDCIQHPI